MEEEPTLLSFLDSTPDSSLYQFMLPADKIKLKLSKFGLTPNESKVFILLGKYGEKTAVEVTRNLKMPRTETYRILSSLQNKGIAYSTFDHPTHFSVLPIDETLDMLLKTELERVRTLQSEGTEIKEIWESLPSFSRNGNNPIDEKFQILKGQNSIISNINEMIGKAEKGLMLLGPERHFMKLYHADSLDLLESSRSEIRILTLCSANSIPIFEKISNAKIRRTPFAIHNNPCFMIKDNAELICFIKNDTANQEMIAIRTDSTALIYTMALLFNNLWSSSEDLISGQSLEISYGKTFGDKLCTQ